MHFQVRTDNRIQNTAELADAVRTDVEAALLPQYADQARRVEVYLQDQNAQKGGVDIRCTIEVHLAGYQPVAVSNDAAAIEEAVDGAVEKLRRTMERSLGRLEDRGDRVSMSGNPT